MIISRNYVYRWFNVTFALLATLATPYILKDSLQAFSLSNSLFSVMVFFGYYSLLQFAAKCMDQKRSLLSSVLGFVFSAFMVCGKNVYTTNSLHIMEIKTWVYIVLWLLFFPHWFHYVFIIYQGMT